MNQWVKVLIMLVVLTIWGSAMSYWIFVQHSQPDPLSWGIPGACYLTLWPQLPGRSTDKARKGRNR